MTDDDSFHFDFDSPDLWKNKGDEFFRQGNYKDAIRCYSQAIELKPDYISAWNNLGFAFHKLGKTGESDKIKEKVRQLKEQSGSKSENIPNNTGSVEDKPKNTIPGPIPVEPERKKSRFCDHCLQPILLPFTVRV